MTFTCHNRDCFCDGSCIKNLPPPVHNKVYEFLIEKAFNMFDSSDDEPFQYVDHFWTKKDE